jgi:Fe2+ transport system protein B
MRPFHFVNTPSGVQREETFEDIDDVLINKAWVCSFFLLILVSTFPSDTRKISKISKFADAPSGTHTEEMSEQMKEAELDEKHGIRTQQ